MQIYLAETRKGSPLPEGAVSMPLISLFAGFEQPPQEVQVLWLRHTENPNVALTISFELRDTAQNLVSLNRSEALGIFYELIVRIMPFGANLEVGVTLSGGKLVVFVEVTDQKTYQVAGSDALARSRRNLIQQAGCSNLLLEQFPLLEPSPITEPVEVEEVLYALAKLIDWFFQLDLVVAFSLDDTEVYRANTGESD